MYIYTYIFIKLGIKYIFVALFVGSIDESLHENFHLPTRVLFL